MSLDALRQRDVWWVHGFDRRGEVAPLPPAAWLDFARAANCAASRLEVFGRSHDGREPGPSDIVGFRAQIAERSASMVLPLGSLGDLTSEEADDAEVYSATQLARQIVARCCPSTGAPAHPVAVSAAGCALWSGPMTCFEASSPWVHVYDQRQSFLRAWDQPMARPGADWHVCEGPDAERAALDPDAVGFALAELDAPGESFIPAATGGDVFRAPLAGRSTVPVSLWALRAQLLPAGLRLGRVVACAWTRAWKDIDFESTWREHGAKKAAYQRAFSAIDPGDRWSGYFRGASVIWRRQAPDVAMPEIAALGRWACAGKTAALLMRLHRIGHPVVLAHIDSVFTEGSWHLHADGSRSPGHDPAMVWTGEAASYAHGTEHITGYDDGFTRPGSVAGWVLKDYGEYRGYGPGRYDLFGGQHRVAARMGGGGLDAEDGMFLRARRWVGDPRRDPMATSACLPARGKWYEYSFGGRVYSGHHE